MLETVKSSLTERKAFWDPVLAPSRNPETAKAPKRFPENGLLFQYHKQMHSTLALPLLQHPPTTPFSPPPPCKDCARVFYTAHFTGRTCCSYCFCFSEKTCLKNKPPTKGRLIAQSQGFAVCWWLLFHAQVWYCHTKAAAPPGGTGSLNPHKCSKKNKDALPTWVITVVSRWVSSWCDISSSFSQKSISHRELHSIQKKMHPEWEAAHSLPHLHTKQGPLPRHGPSSSHIFSRLLTSSNLLPSMHGRWKAPSRWGFYPPRQKEGSRRGEI